MKKKKSLDGFEGRKPFVLVEKQLQRVKFGKIIKIIISI